MSTLKKLETVAASVTHALEHCSVQPSLVSNCCKAWTGGLGSWGGCGGRGSWGDRDTLQEAWPCSNCHRYFLSHQILWNSAFFQWYPRAVLLPHSQGNGTLMTWRAFFSDLFDKALKVKQREGKHWPINWTKHLWDWHRHQKDPASQRNSQPIQSIKDTVLRTKCQLRKIIIWRSIQFQCIQNRSWSFISYITISCNFVYITISCNFVFIVSKFIESNQKSSNRADESKISSHDNMSFMLSYSEFFLVCNSSTNHVELSALSWSRASDCGTRDSAGIDLASSAVSSMVSLLPTYFPACGGFGFGVFGLVRDCYIVKFFSHWFLLIFHHVYKIFSKPHILHIKKNGINTTAAMIQSHETLYNTDTLYLMLNSPLELHD